MIWEREKKWISALPCENYNPTQMSCAFVYTACSQFSWKFIAICAKAFYKKINVIHYLSKQKCKFVFSSGNTFLYTVFFSFDDRWNSAVRSFWSPSQNALLWSLNKNVNWKETTVVYYFSVFAWITWATIVKTHHAKLHNILCNFCHFEKIFHNANEAMFVRSLATLYVIMNKERMKEKLNSISE